MDNGKINSLSAVIYISISLFFSLIFILLTGGGRYTPVERYGGATWIFVLTMIITMPIIIPWIKKKYQA